MNNCFEIHRNVLLPVRICLGWKATAYCEMEAKVVFRLIFSIVYSTIVCSTATPLLITLPEMYEVRDGEAFQLHHDSVSGQRKTKVNLERLEVVRNDLVFGLPFESCIEEKMTRDNKYAASDRHNSRFEEVHQVGTRGVLLGILGGDVPTWSQFQTRSNLLHMFSDLASMKLCHYYLPQNANRIVS